MMENIITSSFSLNLSVMKVIGLYPLKRHPYLYKLLAFVIYTFAMIPATVLGFLQLFFKEDMKKVRHDDLAPFVVIFLSPKLLSIVTSGHRIEKCLQFLDVEFFTVVDSQHIKIINNCVKICRRNSVIFFSGCVVSVFGWTVKMFFREDIHQLPLDVWYPFEIRNTLYYVLYVSLVLGIVS
jgi:hypothetical protein